MADMDNVLSNRAPADLDKLHSVMVFNLSYRTTKEDLFELFEKYGKVVDVHIPRSRRSEPKGFAFVRYLERSQAVAATETDGTDFMGRQLGVQLAKYGRRDAQRQSRARDGDRYRGGRCAEFYLSRSLRHFAVLHFAELSSAII